MKRKKQKTEKLKKADLHAHTNLTDGFASPQEMVLTAKQKGISFLAITDHNQILPAQIAQQFAREHNLELQVIIGEEVDTKSGEIIGLFLKKRIPKLMDARSACRMIKSQGGLVCIPHPFRIIIGKGLNIKSIKNLVDQNLVDLIEVANLWDYPGLIKKRKQLLNGSLNIPWLANSDSHSSETLGRYCNLTTARNLDELKRELLEGRVIPFFPKITKKEQLGFIGCHLSRRLGQILQRGTAFSNKVTTRTKIKRTFSYYNPAFSFLPTRKKLFHNRQLKRLLKHSEND